MAKKGVFRLVEQTESHSAFADETAHSQKSHQDDVYHADDVGLDDEEFVRLSKEDVERLGLAEPDFVLLKQWRWQLLAALLSVLVVWLLARDLTVTKVAVYGAACGLLPSGLFALAQQMHSKLSEGLGLMYFFVCEAVKLLLSLGMLVVGAYYVSSLGVNKVALLCMVITYIVVLKFGWVQVVFDAWLTGRRE